MKPLAYGHKGALFLCCLMSLLLASCSRTIRSEGRLHTDRQTTQAAGMEENVEITFASMFTLATPLYLYYVEHDQWPNDASQLEEVARKWEVPFDVSDYSSVDMQEMDDGRLRVHFELAPPNHGEGEFVLSKPQVEHQVGAEPDMLM